jgi:16S rRNA (guanine527-N7)-methyltransferase
LSEPGEPAASRRAGSPALCAQLDRARDLGLLGPGPAGAHLEHALGFLPALEGVTGRVIDLGSGGGVPGLPLAEARPDLELVLVESSAKRCAFLESAVEAIGLQDRVSVEMGRAEVVGRGPLRGSASAVVARSFGAPAVTAECAAPLLAPGGRIAVSEPPDSGNRWPAEGLARLGLERQGEPQGTPRIQVLVLAQPCPEAYPRRDGIPGKRPLF